MGQIQYTKISDRKCNECTPTFYDIPIGSTPYEIAVITGFSLEQTVSISENIIQENNNLCPTIYLSAVQSKDFKKYCDNGQGSVITVTTALGQFSSQFNQQDADNKALEYLNSIGQQTANQLGTCPESTCLSCPDFEVVRTNECGEYRQNKQCNQGFCVNLSEQYFVCTTGNCVGNDCIPVNNCPEGEQGNCPEGYICKSGRCVIDCTNAECSNLCLNGSCPSGSNCINGQCVQDPPPCTGCAPTCLTGSCPQGYNCINGRCIIDCTSAICSQSCPNGSCTDCSECINGRCIPKTCNNNQVLNTTTCQCENIVCNPPCTERRDITKDTSCAEAYTQQKESIVNGQCTCVDDSSQPTRFEFKPNGTECLAGAGLCDGNGNCQTGCLTTCPQDTSPVIDSVNNCLENLITYDCVLDDCIPRNITRQRIDGSACTNSENEQSTCLSGNCQDLVNCLVNSIQVRVDFENSTYAEKAILTPPTSNFILTGKNVNVGGNISTQLSPFPEGIILSTNDSNLVRDSFWNLQVNGKDLNLKEKIESSPTYFRAFADVISASADFENNIQNIKVEFFGLDHVDDLILIRTLRIVGKFDNLNPLNPITQEFDSGVISSTSGNFNGFTWNSNTPNGKNARITNTVTISVPLQTTPYQIYCVCYLEPNSPQELITGEVQYQLTTQCG